MRYAQIGSSGLQVSRVGLGMMGFGDAAWRPWVQGEDEAFAVVERAATWGVTFFDTANVYSNGESERITGRVLAKVFGDREDYVLATKVGSPSGPAPYGRGLSRKHIMAAIDASLARLGVDYVDLYYVHRFDPDTPVGETMAALHDVVQSGKVRYLGASSMYTWQFAKMQHTAEAHGLTRFVAMQNHYNALYREEEREMIPYCVDAGVGVIPWSPLARGLLARRGQTARSQADAFADRLYSDADRPVADAVTEVARHHEVAPAQIALAWLLANPAVAAPIVGAMAPGHVDDAIAAVDLDLSDRDCADIDAPYKPHPVAGIDI